MRSDSSVSQRSGHRYSYREEHLHRESLDELGLLDQQAIAQSPRLALNSALLRAFREAAEDMQSLQIVATLAPSSLLIVSAES